MASVVLACTLALAGLAIGAAPAGAGQGQAKAPSAAAPALPDKPWAPWVGCWQREEPVEAGSPGLRVCVEEAGGAVVLRTKSGTATVLEERVPTSEGSQPVDTPGCQGTQRAAWASTGHLFLMRSEVTCDGRPPQVVSRIALLRTLDLWTDVVVVESNGRETVFLRKYRRTDPAPRADAGSVPPGGAMLSIDGLKYAASMVSPRALEALLAETRPRYKLDGKTLVALRDSGLPPSTIDLLVALSMPERFEVSSSRRGGGGGGGYAGFSGFPIGLFPVVPYAAEWGGAPLWASDGDYWYWGGCGYWDCLGPGVPVDPGDSGGGSGGEGATATHGRVVAGQGYVRVYPREPADASRGDGGQGSGTRGDPVSGSDGRSSGDSTSSSSNVSPQGYSGSSGSDTGRTAEPRTPPPD